MHSAFIRHLSYRFGFILTGNRTQQLGSIIRALVLQVLLCMHCKVRKHIRIIPVPEKMWIYIHRWNIFLSKYVMALHPFKITTAYSSTFFFNFHTAFLIYGEHWNTERERERKREHGKVNNLTRH